MQFRVLTPTFRPVGGVVKIFDYVVHAQSVGLEPIVYCPEPLEPDLPLFSIEHFSGLLDSVRFGDLRTLRIQPHDLVFFSWPTHYDLIAARAARKITSRRAIHIVQNTRHGNPSWLRGYATRLLMRPLTRIMIAKQVREACEPFVNRDSLTTTIVEGHNWEYFSLERPEPLRPPIRVAYTTWKSDIGSRVAMELESHPDYEFRSISETVGWKELRDLYHWCDVFMAAPGPQEGFYLPGLEAMAAEAILITPDVGGNMQYCQFGENCIGVEFDDVESYLVALAQIKDLPGAEIKDLRQSARHTLASHRLDTERQGFEELLSQLGSG